MKKVTTIRKSKDGVAVAVPVAAPVAVAVPVPAVPVPSPLVDHESTMLRHLMRLKDRAEARAKAIVAEADADVSEFVRSVLTSRQLDFSEWGIALADMKTINKLEKPITPTPVPAAVPAAPAQA